MAVIINNHPLMQHKITQLRNINYKKVEFRRLSKELGELFAYELTRDLETHDVEVATPLETTMSPEIIGKKPAVVAILRAGLGLQSGLLEVMPEAKEGYIDASRDEITLVADIAKAKLPLHLSERRIYVTEHMLATGSTSIKAIHCIKKNGGLGRNIKFIATIAAPEGLEALKVVHPDIDIYIGHLDRELDENGYIRPGLGDAGDRMSGTL